MTFRKCVATGSVFIRMAEGPDKSSDLTVEHGVGEVLLRDLMIVSLRMSRTVFALLPLDNDTMDDRDGVRT